MLILVINPGGTSTKIAVFDGTTEVFSETIFHNQEDLQNFSHLLDQFNFRESMIIESLKKQNIDIERIGCVVSRGGLMKPINGGVYPINQAMINDMENAINGEHASNLGVLLAKSIAESIGVNAYTVDPVSVDEFCDEARITGIKDIVKASWLHALNQKAVCRTIAKQLNGKYQDFNFIAAHLGSGISIAAHEKGRMIDGSGGRSDGPFSPERSGGLLAYPLVKLCYSGKYTEDEMIHKISNIGGFYDYLGTKDVKKIEEMIENGDKQAKAIMEAFAYQVAKEISMYGAVLFGKVDRIILTGGISFSDYITNRIARRVAYIAPVEILPGEMEMLALAQGVIRLLNGEELPQNYE